jgi:hypothetical protein
MNVIKQPEITENLRTDKREINPNKWNFNAKYDFNYENTDTIVGYV